VLFRSAKGVKTNDASAVMKLWLALSLKKITFSPPGWIIGYGGQKRTNIIETLVRLNGKIDRGALEVA
jgi:hypothetical protein